MKLDDAYALIPGINCRGLCWDQCTVVPATDLERRRMAEAGHPIPTWEDGVLASTEAGETQRCPALSAFGRCRAYASRPAMCRLYGVAEGLRCPHGCVPDRVLADSTAAAVLAAVESASQ